MKNSVSVAPSTPLQAVRELGEAEGSSLRAVEKFVHGVYEIELDQVGIQTPSTTPLSPPTTP